MSRKKSITRNDVRREIPIQNDDNQEQEVSSTQEIFGLQSATAANPQPQTSLPSIDGTEEKPERPSSTNRIIPGITRPEIDIVARCY